MEYDIKILYSAMPFPKIFKKIKTFTEFYFSTKDQANKINDDCSQWYGVLDIANQYMRFLVHPIISTRNKGMVIHARTLVTQEDCRSMVGIDSFATTMIPYMILAVRTAATKNMKATVGDLICRLHAMKMKVAFR